MIKFMFTDAKQFAKFFVSLKGTQLGQYGERFGAYFVEVVTQEQWHVDRVLSNAERFGGIRLADC